MNDEKHVDTQYIPFPCDGLYTLLYDAKKSYWVLSVSFLLGPSLMPLPTQPLLLKLQLGLPIVLGRIDTVIRVVDEVGPGENMCKY